MKNWEKDALIERLKKALEMIREDDTREERHPCDPPRYGYFGTIADAALRGIPLGRAHE